MKTVVPNYYSSFICIADKCKHTCCAGWEIDIDGNTYNYYKTLPGDFGIKLCEKISLKPTTHFKLTDNERCPFLNDRNLCDIIINIGDSALCDICREHPRFRNFYSDRIEVGLGLCCEAASKLIINFDRKTSFVVTEQDGGNEVLKKEERHFFEMRETVFGILQNRSLSITERINTLIRKYYLTRSVYLISEWAQVYLKLECLEAEWNKQIRDLCEMKHIDESVFSDVKWETAFEQILVYFVYRHLEESIYDGRFRERLMFALLSLNIIKSLCMLKYKIYGYVTIKDLEDISRSYSSEIEYSEENTETLLIKLRSSI